VSNYRGSKEFDVATLASLGYHKNTEIDESAGFDRDEHTEDSVPGSPDYSPGYYATFILDPDGKGIETDSYDHGQSKDE
jgi:hypothetical protein